MATIDLTTQSLIGLALTEDSSGFVTVNFTNGATLNLGSLKMETAHYRAFVESLAQTARTIFPDSLTQPAYCKTVVFVGTQTSTVQF